MKKYAQIVCVLMSSISILYGMEEGGLTREQLVRNYLSPFTINVEQTLKRIQMYDSDRFFFNLNILNHYCVTVGVSKQSLDNLKEEIIGGLNLYFQKGSNVDAKVRQVLEEEDYGKVRVELAEPHRNPKKRKRLNQDVDQEIDEATEIPSLLKSKELREEIQRCGVDEEPTSHEKVLELDPISQDEAKEILGKYMKHMKRNTR